MAKQIWSMVTSDIRAITNQPMKFYESSTELSESAMWKILTGMTDSDGNIPLIVENPKPWWRTTELRGKIYSLVPFDKIELISSYVIEDNERLHFSDIIRGTTSER